LIIALSRGAGCDAYSAFAGTTADLAFLCQANQGALDASFENNFILDGIQFSTQSVPEPNSAGLFALGGLFMAWWCSKANPIKVKQN